MGDWGASKQCRQADALSELTTHGSPNILLPYVKHVSDVQVNLVELSPRRNPLSGFRKYESGLELHSTDYWVVCYCTLRNSPLDREG